MILLLFVGCFLRRWSSAGRERCRREATEDCCGTLGTGGGRESIGGISAVAVNGRRPRSIAVYCAEAPNGEPSGEDVGSLADPHSRSGHGESDSDLAVDDGCRRARPGECTGDCSDARGGKERVKAKYTVEGESESERCRSHRMRRPRAQDANATPACGGWRCPLYPDARQKLPGASHQPPLKESCRPKRPLFTIL